MSEAVINASRDKRAQYHKRLEAITEAASKREGAEQALTDAEAKSFEKLTGKIKDISKDIARLEKDAERAAKAEEALAEQPAVGGAVVRSEQMTYDEFSGNSYFRDLAFIAAATKDVSYGRSAEEAIERRTRHAREVEVEARTDKSVQRALAEARLEQRVNPNTTAGTGGEFVPPLWLVGQYVPFKRPTRVFANRVQQFSLPPGIDVINIPKITVGSQAGIQSANAAAVQSVDIQTSTVSANVNTIAGQEDISFQLLEQSPIAMDGVIWDDLTRDYDQRLDLQVIGGTGANGQHLGVLNVAQQTSNTSISKANGVTVGSIVFSDASTSGTQFRSVVAGKNFIETLRIAPATAIWVHPRRANSWEYAADTTGRPLFVPYSPFNALGLDNPNIPEGVAGVLSGLPVVKDGNMPVTMNATALTGGTADPVVVLKEDDLYLYEGTMRMRALPEILSGTLQIRFQAYAYSAFLASRFLPSISILTGNTGLAAPAF